MTENTFLLIDTARADFSDKDIIDTINEAPHANTTNKRQGQVINAH